MSTNDTHTRTSMSGLGQFLVVAIAAVVLFIFGGQYLSGGLAWLRDAAKPAQTQIQPADVPRPALPAPGSIRGGTGYAQPQVQQQMEAQATAEQYNTPPSAWPTRNPMAPAVNANPLNSNGQPVISQEQAEQQVLMLDLAAQEGDRAALEAAQDYRAAQDAAAAEAPVKMSKEEAEQTYTNGRDLCSLPRANPHTCALGIPEATPLNAAP